MDIEKLKRTSNELLTYMERMDYSAVHIDRVRKCLSKLYEHGHNFTSYKDFCEGFYSEQNGFKQSREAIINRRKIVSLICKFEEEGKFPNGRRDKSLWRKNSYTALLPSFKLLIDRYKEFAIDKALASNTIKANTSLSSVFLLFAQNAGACELKDITEQMVISFFYDGEKVIHDYGYKKSLKAVLLVNLSSADGNESKRILQLLPNIKSGRKVFPYLKDDEVIKIKQGLRPGGPIELSAITRAVVTIAFYTGLRGVDIATLSLENIDWNRDLIRLRQRKTGVEMTIPMRSVVGNALYDYVMKCRPSSSLFINTMSKPIGVSSDQSMGRIIYKFLNTIGIDTKNGRRGLRAFRHHLATHMMESDVNPAVISNILGHVSPDSINPYIDADIKHLRDCALPIDDFPIDLNSLGI